MSSAAGQGSDDVGRSDRPRNKPRNLLSLAGRGERRRPATAPATAARTAADGGACCSAQQQKDQGALGAVGGRGGAAAGVGAAASSVSSSQAVEGAADIMAAAAGAQSQEGLEDTAGPNSEHGAPFPAIEDVLDLLDDLAAQPDAGARQSWHQYRAMPGCVSCNRVQAGGIARCASCLQALVSQEMSQLGLSRRMVAFGCHFLRRVRNMLTDNSTTNAHVGYACSMFLPLASRMHLFCGSDGQKVEALLLGLSMSGDFGDRQDTNTSLFTGFAEPDAAKLRVGSTPVVDHIAAGRSPYLFVGRRLTLGVGTLGVVGRLQADRRTGKRCCCWSLRPPPSSGFPPRPMLPLPYRSMICHVAQVQMCCLPHLVFYADHFCVFWRKLPSPPFNNFLSCKQI